MPLAFHYGLCRLERVEFRQCFTASTEIAEHRGAGIPRMARRDGLPI